MRSKGLAGNYTQLTPRERLQLILEAQGRDDKADAQRLGESCPRKDYRQSDAAFFGPYEAVEKITMAFAIDLAYQLGQIRMLQTNKLMMPPLTLLAAQETTLLYEQAEAFADHINVPEGIVQSKELTAPEPIPQDKTNPSDRIDEIFAEYFPKTRKIFGGLHEDLLKSYAERVNGILHGLDRFAQRVLGVEGNLLLRAWFPCVLDYVDYCDIGAVAPDEQWTKDYEEMAVALWRKYLGSE